MTKLLFADEGKQSEILNVIWAGAAGIKSLKLSMSSLRRTVQGCQALLSRLV